jgi:hypothetical protein
MAICAFVWDFETNVGTALIAFWPNLTIEKLFYTEFVTGGLFMVFHQLSDFLLGMSIAPLIIIYLIRLRGSAIHQSRREILVKAR